MSEFLSTTEAAKLLGVSRIAVFQKIQSGNIPAKKIGGIYIIDREDLQIPGEKLTVGRKLAIDESVKKVIADYGDTLKLLKDA